MSDVKAKIARLANPNAPRMAIYTCTEYRYSESDHREFN